jgi:hypothetical protein
MQGVVVHQHAALRQAIRHPAGATGLHAPDHAIALTSRLSGPARARMLAS